ncbi:hypothetical protein [Azotobacter chroococcum]|uniref:hypothetical protein n=1 Tax=Azotobacter chroococcum TaxID=353 RepID=UPI000AAC44F6|nr:hypothetical protein [Azotobacter chroococcum]
MQDADLEIKNESVLTSAVEMVNDLPLTQSDVKGDIYEYLLSKLTTRRHQPASSARRGTSSTP